MIASPTRRAGFTLVELLVVIVIIAMLAALISAAAFPAINAAKRARITTEISLIDGALKAYKLKYGSYPPSNMTNTPANRAAVVRHLTKAFPNHRETVAIAPDTVSAIDAIMALNMTEAQALVFWLKGFHSNKEFPLSGDGRLSTNNGEGRQPIFEFDKARLIGLDEVKDHWGLPIYAPDDAMGAPYVYFRADSYIEDISGGFRPATCEPVASSGNVARPYPTSIVTGGDGSAKAHLKWANAESYQLISAGLDEQYGRSGLFPTGQPYRCGSYAAASNGYLSSDIADNDNLTNFSAKQLGDAKD